MIKKRSIVKLFKKHTVPCTGLVPQALQTYFDSVYWTRLGKGSETFQSCMYSEQRNTKMGQLCERRELPFPEWPLKCTDTLISMRMVWLCVMGRVPTEFLTSLPSCTEVSTYLQSCVDREQKKKPTPMECIRDFSLLLKCLAIIFCIKLKAVTFTAAAPNGIKGKISSNSAVDNRAVLGLSDLSIF